MQDQQKFIILHLDDKAWQLKDIIVNEESVTGSISELVGHERYKSVKPDNSNRYLKSKSHDESYILSEVHIYVTEYSEAENGRISIPAGAIEKIEIYDKDKGATTASWAFSCTWCCCRCIWSAAGNCCTDKIFLPVRLCLRWQ